MRIILVSLFLIFMVIPPAFSNEMKVTVTGVERVPLEGNERTEIIYVFFVLMTNEDIPVALIISFKHYKVTPETCRKESKIQMGPANILDYRYLQVIWCSRGN